MAHQTPLYPIYADLQKLSLWKLRLILVVVRILKLHHRWEMWGHYYLTQLMLARLAVRRAGGFIANRAGAVFWVELDFTKAE